jgi:hypothetical protein
MGKVEESCLRMLQSLQQMSQIQVKFLQGIQSQQNLKSSRMNLACVVPVEALVLTGSLAVREEFIQLAGMNIRRSSRAS